MTGTSVHVELRNLCTHVYSLSVCFLILLLGVFFYLVIMKHTDLKLTVFPL